MNPADIARYLRENPGFFEDHAYVLADIYIPHPHGGRAISISERQVIAARDKVKLLESKLGELIRFGEENDTISEKMHRLSLALLEARGVDAVRQAIEFNLKEDFAVPHIALRMWSEAEASEEGDVDDATRAYRRELDQPVCGSEVPEGVLKWFGEDAPRLRSFALIAFEAAGREGLLAMASEDAERFYPEMGTLYLKRLGEMAGAALRREMAEG